MTYFAELSSPQVAALASDERVPVLLLPVGAVEPHGPHAPLGTDPLISRGMCERAAARLAGDPGVRVLILPEVPYGVTRLAAGFAGGISIGEETLYALLTEICGALAEQGLTRILLVNNHFEPAHLTVLRRVAETAGVGFVDLVRRRYAERLTDEFRSGECHAGQYETALVLADRPDLVDAAVQRDLPPVHVDLARTTITDFGSAGMTEAYCGSPAQATAEEGEKTFSVLTDILVEAIRELV